MKKVIRTVLIAFCFILAVLPASAVSAEEVMKRQEEIAGLEDLQEAADMAGGDIDYGTELDEGLSRLWDSIGEGIHGVLREMLRSGLIMLVIVVLCGVSETMFDLAGKCRVPVMSAAATLAIAAVAVSDVNSMIGMGKETIEKITTFSNVLLPTVAAVTAMTGSVTGAAVKQMAAVLFSDILVNLIDKLLVPMLYGFLAASIAYSATKNEGLKRFASFIKWAITTILTVVMLCYVGYLSVSGVISGASDAMTIKATKFAISGAIPVIGGVLSDAADTILASAGVLKSSVGVFGMLTILSICLIPILKLAVHYLLYKLVSAVSATVGTEGTSALIELIGSAFALMLGMTGSSCLLLLISLVSSLIVVNV